jgi:uncharacterized protein YlaN (UPF0358 family)
MTPADKLQKFSSELPSYFGIAVKKLILTPIDELTTPQFQLIQKGLSTQLFEEWIELHVQLKLQREETELLTAWLSSPFSDRPELYEGWKMNYIKSTLETKLYDDFNFDVR